MPKLSSALAASRMISRSESLPIRMATCAFFFILSICLPGAPALRCHADTAYHRTESDRRRRSACQRIAQVAGASADVQDASPGGDDLAIAPCCAGVEDLHALHACCRFQAGDWLARLVAARIAARGDHDAA